MVTAERPPAAPLFEVAVRPTGDRDAVVVSGELDVASAPELRAVVGHLLAAGRRHILLDLDGVTFVDGAGIGALIASDLEAREAGGCLEVTEHAGCRRILRITGETGRLRMSARPVDPG